MEKWARGLAIGVLAIVVALVAFTVWTIQAGKSDPNLKDICDLIPWWPGC